VLPIEFYLNAGCLAVPVLVKWIKVEFPVLNFSSNIRPILFLVEGEAFLSIFVLVFSLPVIA
jgi:hypothetical protein